MMYQTRLETPEFVWSGVNRDPDEATHKFLHDGFLSVPNGFRFNTKKSYSFLYAQKGAYTANRSLFAAVEDCKQHTFSPAAIAYAAANHAMECQRIIKTISFDAATDYAARQGVAIPPAGESPEAIQKHRAYYSSRLVCPTWWNRRMVTTIERRIEGVAVRFGVVSRQAQLYVSDEIFSRIDSRKRRSALVLSQMVAVSEDGEEINMLDILNKSIANPEVRRAELMVRLAGFEQYAIAKNHPSMFFTVTCPSKFHATHANGTPNKKYADEVTVKGKVQKNSPKVAQAYLSNVWAKVRARHNDLGHSKCYGFRIAEPHHDGCPHWHIVLFGESSSLAAFSGLLEHFACAEDSNELKQGNGARFTVEEIDYKKGSAVSYVAKYIAKNVDGYAVGVDGESVGERAAVTAERVKAWSSVWGIRQFQQIGGAPVGVWRELRRVSETVEGSDKMELARVAADLSDWYGYQVQQGGAESARADMPLRSYSEEFDVTTGEVNTNRYDETVKIVKGISEGAYILRTRNKKWAIGFKSAVALSSLLSGETGQPWTCVNNCNPLSLSPEREKHQTQKTGEFH